jgi:hypothetical protein
MDANLNIKIKHNTILRLRTHKKNKTVTNNKLIKQVNIFRNYLGGCLSYESKMI